MQYHSGEKSTWSLQVFSNGTVVSAGNNGLPIPPDSISVTKILQTANGSHLSVGYDSTNNRLKYKAHVALNSYLAIGWGSGMENTPMVAW